MQFSHPLTQHGGRGHHQAGAVEAGVVEAAQERGHLHRLRWGGAVLEMRSNQLHHLRCEGGEIMKNEDAVIWVSRDDERWG